MYYNGQVVHDLDKDEPVQVGDEREATQWAWCGLPRRSSPYYCVVTGRILLPRTIATAQEWLKNNYARIGRDT